MNYDFTRAEKPPRAKKFRPETNLIGKKLAELALSGEYYDSKML